MGPSEVPLTLLTDSYKASHFTLYPDVIKMVCYGEFRQSYENDLEDQRIIFFGLRYILETYIFKRWTLKDVEKAKFFFQTHNYCYSKFPFPEKLFHQFIAENDGYFPVNIEALPEGSVIYPHTPVYQITAENQYSPLCTYLETILTMCWYPSTVATLSRRMKDIIYSFFEESVEEKNFMLIESRLHDFGFRGCTCVEQSILGGTAHLLNFTGSDTLSACYYGQYEWNEGRPIAQSIPATEHSIVLAHRNEKDSIRTMMEQYGTGMYACVIDTYNYNTLLSDVLPSLVSLKSEKGGVLILRPDSGDPVITVVETLKAADRVFGSVINEKGYKVLNRVGVIQGDGVTFLTLRDILRAVVNAGFSAENVSFGCGSALLQRCHRDTLSFATKLSHVVYKDGSSRNVMKSPVSDSKKFSLAGELEVILDKNSHPVVYPKRIDSKENLLKMVYNKGPVSEIFDSFEDVRKRIEMQWNMRKKKFDCLSLELKQQLCTVQLFNNDASQYSGV